MAKTNKEYTPWRQFLAWVGFITLIILAVAVVAFIIWGNQYIAAAGY